MVLVTSETIIGKNCATLGLVSGNTVQSKNAIRDFGAGFKNLVGGELSAYTEMMGEARAIATQRMIDQAEQMGADAIVAMRYLSTTISQQAAEVLAYGTAVKFI